VEIPLVYRLAHATGTVELELTSSRFVVRTKGNGLADRLRTIDVPVSAVRLFAVTPAFGAQTRVAYGSYDAELLLRYDDAGSTRTKRLFVRAEDHALRALLEQLAALRPDASLLGVPPAEAYARIGVLSPRRAVWIVIAVAVLVPLAGIAISIALEECR